MARGRAQDTNTVKGGWDRDWRPKVWTFAWATQKKTLSGNTSKGEVMKVHIAPHKNKIIIKINKNQKEKERRGRFGMVVDLAEWWVGCVFNILWNLWIFGGCSSKAKGQEREGLVRTTQPEKQRRKKRESECVCIFKSQEGRHVHVHPNNTIPCFFFMSR